MFSSFKQRLLLGVYIFLILSIPVGAYLVSQQQVFKSRADEQKTQDKIDSPIGKKLTEATGSGTTAQQEIKNLLSSPTPTISPSPSPTPTTATTFGPTMNFKLILEGRPTGKQASSVFVGISSGITSGKQTSYLLSFTIDLPDTGIYEGLSLAGLTSGSQYTAFIKPTAQIATSSAFIASPSITTLNGDQALTLYTGDLNEDNVINAADYNIAKSVYRATPASTNWNPTADFNKDDLINNYDLAYIINNMDKTGESGVWVSTPAGGILPEATTNPHGEEGYWLWVPK